VNPERERLLLLVLAGIQMAHIVDFMVMMPLGPMLMQELNVGTREFGLLVSAYTFTAAISGILFAAIIDRFERKKLLLTLLVFFVLATLACGLAPGFATLFAARCAAGAFGGVLGALVHTIVGDLIPFERRGSASGTIMAAFSASTVAGVPASLFLANHFGWRFPFLLVALVTCGFIVIGWRLLPTLHGHLNTTEESAHPLAAMRETLGEPNHFRAMAFMALVIFASFMVIPYITLAIVGNVGIPQSDIPLVYLCGGLASFFSARWIGRLADRHGKVRVYRHVAIGSLVPLLLITHLGPAPLVVLLTVTTLFFILVPGRMVPAMAIATSATRPGLRGTFLALNAASLQLASGLAAVTGGLIITTDAEGRLLHYEWTGYNAIVMTALALWLVGKIRLHA
jgi:predicted MFS family arabinose efflux permease